MYHNEEHVNGTNLLLNELHVSKQINVLYCYTVLVIMERMIQQTIDYTRERKAFGKSILDNQYVHFRLAEMETEVEALRSLVYRATGKMCVLCRTPSTLLTICSSTHGGS